jgi:HEAT repeat protein
MISTNALLALAVAVAFAGLGPMAYVLLRQLKDRRVREAALLRMNNAREVVAKGRDVATTARALAEFDMATVDRTIEQLLLDEGPAERMSWVVSLADQVGTVGRYCERARTGASWNERAHAVRMLGSLNLPATVPALTAVLRDRYEDEVVRNLAADAMAKLQDASVVPLLIAELKLVDEQATPRVAEALIRFGHAATAGLIELLETKEHTAARVWAARILATTRDSAAVEVLIMGVRDRHDLLRAASAEALGAIADQRALSLLMQVALRDPAPLVRAQAALAAAQVSGPEASDVLVAALGDPDYATRLRALEAFESMRLADTSALEKALNDSNTEVQRRAALALERLGYLDRLVERLTSDDRQARAAAYTSLLQLGRAGLVEGIAGRIRHESMQVRTAIARACGELRVERVGPTLLSAIDDPSWPVRASLCEAIGQLRPKGGGKAMLGMLADPEESVREAAANALAAYAGAETEGGHDALRMAYEHGSVPIRLSMIALASCIDTPVLSQLLLDATRDPSEAVRLRAVGALAARPNPAAIPALTAALTDASIEVRMAAVPALGAAGTADSFEALLRTLSGAQPALRERIAEALSGVGRHHLLSSIQELARSEQLDVRLGMVWTLGKIGDPSGVPVLSDFLRDPDARLRASAAGALGKIPVADSVRALVAGVDDPDPKTRAAVVNALGKCGAGHSGVQVALERRLHDPDAFVRNRAGIALARAVGAAAAELAQSKETARLLSDPALVIMQGLAGTPETVALALRALSDPARLPNIQQFFDREEAPVCSAFLASLRLREPGTLRLDTRLDPAALAIQYERLLRSSRDANERRAAAEALAGIQGDGQVLIFAEALGADPDDAVRLRCAEVLARRVDNDVARNALIRAVEDPNPQVAGAAVEGLRTRRDPEVARVLFRRLGAGSLHVNQAVEQALAELYRDDPVGFVDRAMGTDRPAATLATIRVLELLAHPSTLPLLRELMKSQDAEVRAAGVRAAAKTGLPEVGALIGRMLDDPHEAVRIGTLEVIAQEGPSALVRLASARADPSVAVRSRLAQLLERFPGTASLKTIDTLLEDASAQVRASALVTLLSFADAESLRRFSAVWQKAAHDTIQQVQQESRGPAVTRKLTHLLSSGGDGTTRELAVTAIAALASEGYEQLLLPVLRDPRTAVRLAAALTLAQSKVPDVQKRVSELMEDPEFAVREAVREALARRGL